MTTTSTAAATASSGGDTPQLTELPEASAVVVGAGEAEMAAWLRQVLEEGSAPDRPADQPAAGGIRTISSSDDVRGAVAAAGKMPVKEKQQYHCPGCCRQPRSGGAGKRSGSGRAAEQRRRDKINEKLRALQRLVPFSNKSDQASTLDGVIQHIKYLQHQLQMMSNCSYSTAVQPYLQPAGGGGSVVAGRGWPPPPTTMLLRQQRQFVVPPPACRPPHHGD
uniref:BHLH domain-containing protein n=1 Tax=Oryza brachyantha TaxID=4533 RepID=J3NEQ6_ORYBR